VFKVLRPGVRARLDRELEVWPRVGEVFGERCRRDGLPDVDYREPFETVANLLRNEISFDAEQRHLEEAGRMLAGVPGVRVPKLLPFCSARITAMERIDGEKATETESLTVAARRRLAAKMVEALLAAPMFSPKPEAMFHADPHAGNLLATPTGELGILDWALVGRLSLRDREQLAQAMLSAQLFDARGVCEAIERLGEHRLTHLPRLRETVDRSLTEMRASTGPGFLWLTKLLDDAALTCGVRFSENLLLFRKTPLILEGVVADVSGEGSLDELLAASTHRQLTREWPQRFLLPPASRGVGSRLSNMDLLRASWLLPWTAALRSMK
jgi:ubiquinone biosynthesis protein